MINPLFSSPFRFEEREPDGTRHVTEFDGEKLHQRVQLPVAQQREAIRAVRQENRGNNGISKDKTLRHIARVPTDVWLQWTREYGPNFHTDEKLVKRLLRRFGFTVVGPESF